MLASIMGFGGGGFTFEGAEGAYRDVLCLGDTDDGVRQLADLLGWREELEGLIAAGQGTDSSASGDKAVADTAAESAGVDATASSSSSGSKPGATGGGSSSQQEGGSSEAAKVQEAAVESTAAGDKAEGSAVEAAESSTLPLRQAAAAAAGSDGVSGRAGGGEDDAGEPRSKV